ncbi:MAG: hypothetical protein ACE5LD_01885 [Candidatus Bipolaricaulia bacterium]
MKLLEGDEEIISRVQEAKVG